LIEEMLIPAELAVPHPRPQRMGHVEQARQVGVDHFLPLRGGHLVEHRVAGDPGVVHQNVDGSDLGLDLGDPGGTGVILRDRPLIGRDAGLLGEGCRRLVVAGIVRRDLVTRRFQAFRNGGPDSAGPAGN